jgi:hypothetical protein
VVERLFDVEDVGSSTLSSPTRKTSISSPPKSLPLQSDGLFAFRSAAVEMTPRRQAMIDAQVAESRRRMADVAFELNDLVRFALSAAKDKGHKVYYPMDPVDEGVRQWATLASKLAKLMNEIEQSRRTIGARPFDPEAPAAGDLGA